MSYNIDYTITPSDTVCSAINKIDNSIRNGVYPALNFLATMQAGNTPPPSPQPNEEWFDTTNNRIKFYIGGSWREWGGVSISGTEITASTVWDSSNLRWNVSLTVNFGEDYTVNWTDDYDDIDKDEAAFYVKKQTPGVYTYFYQDGIVSDGDYHVRTNDGTLINVGNKNLKQLKLDGNSYRYHSEENIKFVPPGSSRWRWAVIQKDLFTGMPDGSTVAIIESLYYVFHITVSSGTFYIKCSYLTPFSIVMDDIQFLYKNLKHDSDYLYIPVLAITYVGTKITTYPEVNIEIVDSIPSGATHHAFIITAKSVHKHTYKIEEGSRSGGYYYFTFTGTPPTEYFPKYLYALTSGGEIQREDGTWVSFSGSYYMEGIANEYIYDHAVRIRFPDSIASGTDVFYAVFA